MHVFWRCRREESREPQLEQLWPAFAHCGQAWPLVAISGGGIMAFCAGAAVFSVSCFPPCAAAGPPKAGKTRHGANNKAGNLNVDASVMEFPPWIVTDAAPVLPPYAVDYRPFKDGKLRNSHDW